MLMAAEQAASLPRCWEARSARAQIAKEIADGLGAFCTA